MNNAFEQRIATDRPPLELSSRDGAGTLSDRVKSLRLPTQPSRQRRGSWVPWLLCAVFAGTSGYLAYQNSLIPAVNESKGGVPEQAATPSTNPSTAVADSGNLALEAKGYIIPAHQIQVSPKVGGMVVKLYIQEEGQRFKKGDILAELETTEYEADANRAKAVLGVAQQRLLELENGNRPEEIEAAKAELKEAEAQREQLFLEWKRNSSLKTGNALAQRDLEAAQSSYLAMDRRMERLRQNYKLMVDGPRKERVDLARAEVRQAQADLAKAQWRLDNTRVVAPLSGTILTKKAEEGNMVNPSAFSNGLSASLCEMADLSELEIELDIQERDIAKVFKGQRCKIRTEAFPDRKYEGIVSRLMPIANRAKGAVPVRVTVTVPRDEEGVYLKPDMGAIVSFLKSEK